MKQIEINIKIGVCQLEELYDNEQALIKTAIEATKIAMRLIATSA